MKRLRVDVEKWLNAWLAKYTAKQLLDHFACPPEYVYEFWSAIYPPREWMSDKLIMFLETAAQSPIPTSVRVADIAEIAQHRFYMHLKVFRLLKCSGCHFGIDRIGKLTVDAYFEDKSKVFAIRALLESLLSDFEPDILFTQTYPC